jgi:heptosyltransferase III
MLKNVRNILVIKLRDIGDLVLSTPVLNVLDENCPAPEIVYVLKKEYEYFKYLLPHVKQVITYDKNDPLDFFRVVFKLRTYKFDLAVNLHATFRSALMALFSGAKTRLVHNHSGKNYFTSMPINAVEKQKSIIERDLDTLRPLKLEITPQLMKTQLVLNNDSIRNIDDEEMAATIGFGVGARRKIKMWHKDRFIDLGRKLSDCGYKIAVFCSAQEKDTGLHVASGIPDAKCYAGLDFLRLAFFLKKLVMFVGNDSGLRHIAAALGVKTVTLFGAENPVEWHPYKEEEGHIAISHLSEYAGINVNTKEFREKAGEVINKITVDEVLAAVKKLE